MRLAGIDEDTAAQAFSVPTIGGNVNAHYLIGT